MNSEKILKLNTHDLFDYSSDHINSNALITPRNDQVFDKKEQKFSFLDYETVWKPSTYQPEDELKIDTLLVKRPFCKTSIWDPASDVTEDD